MAVRVVHASLTGAAANPNVLVDGPKWDADHTIADLTIPGSLAFSGNYAVTVTLTGATTITFPTSGTLATTAGVAAGYQPLDADLTAIAALTTTSYGRALLALADAAAGRTALSLGTSATQNTGTSGANVPLLDGANIWSASAAINKNAAALQAPSSSSETLLHLGNADSVISNFTIDGYGAVTQFRGRRFGGTAASPSATSSGAITSLSISGFTTSTTVASSALITLNANTLWSGSNSDTYIGFETTPTGSTTRAAAMRIQPSGGVSIGAAAIAADPGIGALNLAAALTVGTTAKIGSYTVATLPAGAAGMVAYCSDMRVFDGAGTKEGAGVGTGGIATYTGAWKVAGTNSTAVA